GQLVTGVEHVGAARFYLEGDLSLVDRDRYLLGAPRVGQAVHGQSAMTCPGVGEGPAGAASLGVPVVQPVLSVRPGQQGLPVLIHARPTAGDDAVRGDLGAIDRLDARG